MSLELINFAKQFVAGDLSAGTFADPYISKWSDERDANKLKDDDDNVSECASSIFVLADCYNPDFDRRESELDEDGLKCEVKATLEKFKLS
ncbi:hypothetical protein J2W17_004800 [Pseudomonas lini]|uniref:colicin immunity domain-containing protein n=1 Tax=Pseudomonas lini TaxID=163011 RepID=UPI00278973E4|nr:colicin immunity domain-containing protein [Pseudomonas lini]MDQ0125830.1 hypothetical protein [Pseudomonas lini]